MNTLKRHPHNKQLSITYTSQFNGYPINNQSGMIENYLDKLSTVLSKALHQDARVFAIRFDLRFPVEIDHANDSAVITRFFESLKAKLNHRRSVAIAEQGDYHNHNLRYVWVKEKGRSEGCHYHVIVFLNGSVFSAVGDYSLGSNNLYTRFHEAWASALKIPAYCVKGLVHISTSWHLSRLDDHQTHRFFNAASYLCKSDTKYFEDNSHWFGCSHN